MTNSSAMVNMGERNNATKVYDERFFQLTYGSSIDNAIVRLNNDEFAIRYWLFTSRKVKNGNTVEIKGLYNPGILGELRALGFYKKFDDKNNLIFIREYTNIIAEVSIPIIKEIFYASCIRTQVIPIKVTFDGETFEFSPEVLHKAYLNRYHLIFNDGFLHHLYTHDKPILRDTKHSSFFAFSNCIIKTDKTGFEILPYAELGEECIWEEHISKHSFDYRTDYQDCHFFTFICNVANNEDDRITSFKSAIGYLSHNFNKATGGQVVIAYDESPAPKGQPQGGTGKGVFINALRQIRNIVKIDGKKYRSDDKFKWQSVSPTTQVVWLDDVHTKFPFEDLHSNSTDGWNIEGKYGKEYYLPPAESPKLFLTSNTIMTNTGSTNKRRQFILEFSDHYSKHIITGVEEPIKTEHGCTFFDEEDWDHLEWDKFFSFLIDCSVFYHRNGLITYEMRGLAKNMLLQSTSEEFAEWIEEKGLRSGEKYNLKELFIDFKLSYYGEDSELKQRVFTNWLKIWAGVTKHKLEKSKSNGEQFIVAVTK